MSAGPISEIVSQEFSHWKSKVMRAETQAIVEAIKQSVSLLRRHL